MSENLTVYIAEPRGFCAGVRRAIEIVEQALRDYGAPVYVRHEIVHNKHVIEDLKNKGMIFIDELAQMQDQSRPLIFSAHGVPQSVADETDKLGIKTIDATCPLVAKVHNQIKKLYDEDMEIIVIGKKNHVEIIGTVGQIPSSNKLHIINSKEDIEALNINPESKVGFVTQTTLSVDDTKEIVAALKQKFPSISAMRKDDICFATTNRQKAVKEMAKVAELIIVIGSKNSSNSKQLKEVALKNGAKNAVLIDDASELDWALLKEYQTIGITAGASAPEYLVQDLLDQLKSRYDNIKIMDVKVEYDIGKINDLIEENVSQDLTFFA